MAAAPLLAAGLFAAQPAVAASCQPWSGAQPPKPPNGDTTDFLAGVTVVSACDVWTVGGRDVADGFDTVPLIDHWAGGASWKRFPGPTLPAASRRDATFSMLLDVSAASATSVWAVGFASNHNALIERWNGKNWTATILPSPGGVEGLSGVTALSPTNVWAVGDLEASGRVLIAHWDGHTWSKISSPEPNFQSSELTSVSARSATDIWAVGDSLGKGGLSHTLTEHWDGHQWHLVPSPSPAGGGGFGAGSALASVTAVSANNAWAVGGITSKAGDQQPLIEHWNGTKWTRVTSPVTDGALEGVHAVSASSVWAVGTRQPLGTSGMGLVLHWNGAAWTVRTMPGDEDLGGVAGPSGNVWTVGSTRENTTAFAAPVSAAVPALTSR
jgi:hypothetical protein